MGCLGILAGVFFLGISFLYLPFLSPQNLIIALVLAGISLLIGFSALISKSNRESAIFCKIGGISLVLGSVGYFAVVLFITALKPELTLRTTAEPSRKATVEPVKPDGELQGVGDGIEFLITDGVFSDSLKLWLHFGKVSAVNDDYREPLGISARMDAIYDQGRRVRFVPDQPLHFDTTYVVTLHGQALVDRRNQHISAEWRFTTPSPGIVNGIDQRRFRLIVNDDDSTSLRVEAGAFQRGSLASSVLVYLARGPDNQLLGRSDVSAMWPTVIDFPDRNATPFTRSLFWVAVADSEGRELERFPLREFTDSDSRGVFMVDDENAEHETPDGVTIHFRGADWETLSGEGKAPLFTPVIHLRVESLSKWECLDSIPKGFRFVNCLEISATPRVNPNSESRDGVWDYLRTSLPGGMRRQYALMPRFSLSMPAPAEAEVGAGAVAVEIFPRASFVPRLLLTGVGVVVDEGDAKRIRFFEGGGAKSEESQPSGVRLGEMFEGDAMVGRRAVLVAVGNPRVAIAVGAGWGHIDRNFLGVFTTELPFVFNPPLFGSVRRSDGVVLPMVVGRESLVVARDPTTGWIMEWNEVDVPPSVGWFADIGSLDDLPETDRWSGESFGRQVRAWDRANRRR